MMYASLDMESHGQNDTRGPWSRRREEPWMSRREEAVAEAARGGREQSGKWERGRVNWTISNPP